MRAMVAIVLVLALAGCGRADRSAADGIDSNSPLEAAAREANLVVDPDSTEPTGLYELSHAGGTDAVCLLPADGAAYRFGLVASFGATLMCEGSGTARHSGAQVTLDFDRADCTIEAAYDGQSLAMPGVVPAGCSALCGPRASLSGISVARVGWEEGDARRLRSRHGGRALCGG